MLRKFLFLQPMNMTFQSLGLASSISPSERFFAQAINRGTPTPELSSLFPAPPCPRQHVPLGIVDTHWESLSPFLFLRLMGLSSSISPSEKLFAQAISRGSLTLEISSHYPAPSCPRQLFALGTVDITPAFTSDVLAADLLSLRDSFIIHSGWTRCAVFHHMRFHICLFIRSTRSASLIATRFSYHPFRMNSMCHLSSHELSVAMNHGRSSIERPLTPPSFLNYLGQDMDNRNA